VFVYGFLERQGGLFLALGVGGRFYVVGEPRLWFVVS
jgi:hypothetical protein